MVLPKPRRLLVSCLVAAFVAFAVGSAFAATSGGDDGAAFAVPPARLGDRAVYTLTLQGDWSSDSPLGEPNWKTPWTAVEVAWRDNGTRVDASGAFGPADLLEFRTWDWEPHSAGDGWEWRLEGRAFGMVHRSGEAAPFATDYVGNETGVGSDPADLGLVEVGGMGWHYRHTAYAPENLLTLPDCVFGLLPAVARVGTAVEHDGCQAPWLFQGGYIPVLATPAPLTLEAQRVERVGDVETIVFETTNLRLWLAPGLPVPLRFEVTTGDGTRSGVFDLASFQAGKEPRTERGVWTGAWASVATRPRAQGGMAEDGVDHPFPLSAALEVVRAQDARAARLLAQPDTYVAHADYHESRGYGGVHRRWRLALHDGTGPGGDALALEVDESVPEAFDGAAPALRGAMAERTVARPWEPIAEKLEAAAYPAASVVPGRWPTVGAAWARHEAVVGTPASAWGHQVRCGVDCSEAEVELVAGISSTTIGLSDPAQLRVGQRADSVGDHVAMDPEGRLVAVSRMMVAFDTTQVQPASAPASPVSGGAIERQAMPPSLVAAGAGALALAAGALHYAWPALKAGAVGLFSRVHGPVVLTHPVRSRIMDAVTAEPGIHFKELQRRTGLANGMLVHHLKPLVRDGHVVATKVGRYTVHFPRGAAPAAQAAALKAGGARKVLDAIRERPGATGEQVAAATGLAPSTVSYHAARLGDVGILALQKDGRTLRMFPATAGAA